MSESKKTFKEILGSVIPAPKSLVESNRELASRPHPAPEQVMEQARTSRELRKKMSKSPADIAMEKFRKERA